MKTLYVSDGVHKDAKAEAAKAGMPLSQFVTELIRQALKARRKGGGR